jgi:hypothetical protein
MLGARIFLGERSCFGNMPNFGEKDLFLEHVQQVVEKKHANKEGKSTCRRKSNVTCMQTCLTMIGLGFLTNIVTSISL